jgi:PleD family two-component response regulator
VRTTTVIHPEHRQRPREASSRGASLTERALTGKRILDWNALGYSSIQKQEVRAGGNPGAPRMTIVVVDDNDLNLRLLTVMLGRAGYRVVCAGTALEGIDAIRSETPAAVLMDIGLPGMDGLKAGQQDCPWDSERARSEPGRVESSS